MSERDNRWEIDALKGAAMLAVLVIHGQPLAGSWVHEHLIDRAVPILLVLFGSSSELWWTKQLPGSLFQATTRFWFARLRRLIPPVWIAVLLWWLAMLYLPGMTRPPAWPWLIPHALGYIPQIPTGWFVTLILQLILLFPLLHLFFSRLGPAVCVVSSLFAAIWFYLHMFQVVDWMRFILLDSAPVRGFFVFYYFWIFAPARFPLLFSGMAIARYDWISRGTWCLASGALVLVGAWIHDHVLVDSFGRNALAASLDIPLTIALLGLLRVACPAPARAALCWLGRASWGIYLGQLIVHSVLFTAWLRHVGSTRPMRWVYCGVLLLGGLAWVAADRALRRRFMPVQSASAEPLTRGAPGDTQRSTRNAKVSS